MPWPKVECSIERVWPSGRPPSRESLGDLLGIQVLDHLIFSDEAFHSMLEENEF